MSLGKGDHVKSSKHKLGLTGKIVWEGNVPNKGYQYGIQLDEWNEAGCDGSNNGVFYFRTDPGMGFFSSAKQLTKLAGPPPPNDTGIDEGDQVVLRNGKSGVVKFVGQVGKSKEPVVGLKLSEWLSSGNDGKGYFSVPMGYGYFAKLATVAKVTKADGGEGSVSSSAKAKQPAAEEPSSPVDADIVQFGLGDKVILKRGREGYVKWKGTLNGKAVVGIELLQWDQKGTDGTFPVGPKKAPQKLFDCKQGQGYLAHADKVAEVTQRADHFSPPQEQKQQPPPEPVEIDTTQIQVAIGDKVELRKGRVGFVRYMGPVKGLRGEVIGLELMQWDQKGHNGTYGSDGKQYYTCKDGTGYWTSRNAIATVLESSGAQPIPAVKKSKPQQADEQEEDEQDLPPEMKQDEEILAIGVGDVVRLRKGREGTVKYYNNSSGLVGIELKQWSADAGNGTYKGKSYFECNDGQGYFTLSKNVKTILERLSTEASRPRKGSRGSSSKNKQPEPVQGAVVDFKIGDKVRLGRGKLGTVKFIGKTNFFGDQVVVGLELKDWHANGNDGTHKGTRYFDVRGNGYGYFTKPSAIVEVVHDDDAP